MIIYLFKRLRAIIASNGSIVRTLYYNFRWISKKQALYLPMIVGKRTKIIGTGKIDIKFMLKENPHIYIGCKALKWMDDKEPTILTIDGLMKINEETYIGKGCHFEIGEKGVLNLKRGSNFTGSCTVICKNKISFGEYDLISWDTLFMDSDSHTIIESTGNKNFDKSIVLENHVWIGAKSTILKGSYIANDVVVAAGSIISGQHKQKSCVVGGNPTKILKNDITWDISCPH